MSVDQGALGSGIRGFATGVQAVFGGLARLVSDSALRRLAMVPFAITLVAYALVLFGAFLYVDELLALIWDKPDNWMVYVWYVLVPIIFVGILAALALLFVSAASLVSEPFYEEMVSHILGRHGVPTRPAGFVRGIGYGLGRSLAFFLPAAVCALIGLIPAIGLPFAVAGTALGWIGLASTAINPALVVTGHALGDQLRFPFRSLAVMSGAGAILGLSLLVPVLGLLSMPSAIIGLTELYARTRSGGVRS